MSYSWAQLIVGGAAVYCWLVAGIFLAFSDFVMRSLGAISAAQAITAMQSINVVVYRSVFMVGLFALTAVSLMFIGFGVFGAGSGLIIASGVIYLVAVMGVTGFGNVPLNNKLAVVDPEAPSSVEVWAHYLKVWVRWNHLRTVGSSLAALLMTLAAFKL